MSSVCIQVPGTSANMGPGFDCLGVALQIYNRVTVALEAGGPVDGFVDDAAAAFFRKAGVVPQDFCWEVSGDVPRSRGLGSSVTVRLGLLHGLNELTGSPLSRDQLFRLCADLEGHPDNAAPAAYGGFTIARPDGGMQRYTVGEGLEFILVIPDFEVPTKEARKVLPQAIPFGDAVRSAANACAIAGAFASGDYRKMAGCFVDGLHQPYRQRLVPGLMEVLDAAVSAGALGGWLSGSGSTMAAVTLESGEKVAEAMLAAADNAGAQVVRTCADNEGVRVISGD